MNCIKSAGTIVMRYFKGLFAIWLLFLIPGLTIFVLNSCKKSNSANSKSVEAAREFKETLDETRQQIGGINLPNNKNQALRSQTSATYYVDFPAGTDPQIISNFSDNVTVQALSDVLTTYNASIDDSVNANAEVVIQVPEEPIINMLQPLVLQARNYLKSKGATDPDIDLLLQEENVTEIALVPYVKVLAQTELNQVGYVRSFKLPFIQEANALPHWIECAVEAIGGAALGALLQSNASTWSWPVISSTFKTVAKKFLGPIGVAVAVVTFGICMFG